VKTCNEIQTALRDRFDLGEDFAAFEEDHVAACDACGTYRSDLALLANELALLDLESAPEELSARVIQHVRDHGVDHSLRVGDYIAIAAVASIASVIAGWYMPMWIQPASWWSQATAWLSQGDSTYAIGTLVDRFGVLRSLFNDALTSIPTVSQPMVWIALAVSCTGAVAFNGYMAMRMRTAGD